MASFIGMNKHVLIVEDDLTLGKVMQKSLEKKGYRVSLASTLLQVSDLLQQDELAPFMLAIVDLKLENETTLQLLPRLRHHNQEMKILMLTGYASIATAVEAVKLGADNYLPKPATVNEILKALEEDQENSREPTELDTLSSMSAKRMEWEHIQRVLHKNDGNISATARELNMHRRTLQRKLQKNPVKE